MNETPLVLIVEDDHDIVELLSYCLVETGYRVVAATNGVEALEIGARLKPGLIIMDLIVPEINGLSLCEYFRHSPETATAPILVLSGWVYDIAKPLSIESGATDFVAKPFSPRELIARVQKLLPLSSISLGPQTAIFQRQPPKSRIDIPIIAARKS